MAGIGTKNNIKFKFDIKESNFSGKYLPIQHDTHNTSKDFKFDIDFPIGFDDFDEIDPLSFSDAEVMNYNSKFTSFSIFYTKQILTCQEYQTTRQQRQKEH